MAYSQRIPGADLTGQASSGVSAITYDANGNYSSGGIPFGTCVKRDSSGSAGDFVACSAAGDQADGIAISDPATGPGQSMVVQTLGVAKVLAAAAVNLDDLVYVADTSGRVGTAPAAGATQKYLVGKATQAATAAGDLISVQLMIGAATNVNV